jgi:signal transduction histidine kinase
MSVALDAALRDTLASVQAQRNDAIAYLGVLRAILGALRRMSGLRACAREIAAILTRELHVESCAVLVRPERGARSAVLGFATQGEILGAPAEPHGVESWVRVADALGEAAPFAWCKPSPDGDLVPLAPGELAGESFQVVPFTLGDERQGTIVLHRLVAPVHGFASADGMATIADAVGETLTIAQTRDATRELTEKLEADLGGVRSSLSAREQSLLARERTISRLTDAVLESNRAKRQFLGVISHELRTPLNAIVGFASLLHEDLAQEQSSEHAEMSHAILDRALHLTSLVEDVLLYVDLEAGARRDAEESAVELSALIDEVLVSVGRDASAPIELAIEIDPRVAHPRLDVSLVRRVLCHLVGNAYKFTRAGRVLVGARPGRDLGALELEVSDTGPGMPAERVHQMFDLFTQGDGSSRRAHEGLGLGLTLVQRAVHALGGEVQIDSRPGAGSTVRVQIPNALTVEASAAASS